MTEKKRNKRKRQVNKNSPFSFNGMSFEEALSDLLKIRPEPKPKNKKKTQKPKTNKNKPPMKQLYAKIGPYKVFIVDGERVRKEINEEFTNAAQSGGIKEVPKDELWVDKNKAHSEEYRFFVDHLLAEKTAMKRGKSYNKALKIADRIERRERKRSKIGREVSQKPAPEVFKKAIKGTLGQKGKVRVLLVNGEIVRDKFDVDFTEGGHDKVYPWVPENTVIIDDQIKPKERKFIIFHEFRERSDMEEKKMNYNSAHRVASRLEHEYRENPEQFEKSKKYQASDMDKPATEPDNGKGGKLK